MLQNLHRKNEMPVVCVLVVDLRSNKHEKDVQTLLEMRQRRGETGFSDLLKEVEQKYKRKEQRELLQKIKAKIGSMRCRVVCVYKRAFKYLFRLLSFLSKEMTNEHCRTTGEN